MLAIFSNAKKGKVFALEITTNPSFYNSHCPESDVAPVQIQKKTLITPQAKKENETMQKEKSLTFNTKKESPKETTKLTPSFGHSPVH